MLMKSRTVFFVVAMLFSYSVFAVSFDCSNAATFVERTICSDDELGRMDDALTENYIGMMHSDFGGSVEELKREKIRWIKQRNQCKTRQCIVDAYKKRLDETCDYGVISGVHPICTLSDDFE